MPNFPRARGESERSWFRERRSRRACTTTDGVPDKVRKQLVRVGVITSGFPATSSWSPTLSTGLSATVFAWVPAVVSVRAPWLHTRCASTELNPLDHDP